jgi:hypothetical protein
VAQRSGVAYPVAPVAASYPTASLAAQAYLAESFRSQQAFLAGQVIAAILAVWAQLDLKDVRSSWPALRVALAALIRDRFTASAAAGNAYFLESRLAAGVTGAVPPLGIPGPPDEALIQATLDSTGPWRLLATIKTATQTVPQAVQNTGVVMSGAGMRLVLNGGRQAILQAVQDDARALAWMRVTAANPCAWCAMLASRGAVYKSQQTAGFLAHSHCRCTGQAIFAESDGTFLAENGRLQQEWQRATKGLSGRNARNAWRRYWNAEHPDAVGVPQVA